ncbi:MAG: Dna2/Cas4 domain-containing protein [Beijerinckiaceae bacterium]|nr:Dna2/Cas4 domain-containing protein [Beijerinckiaceae bacterium]
MIGAALMLLAALALLLWLYLRRRVETLPGEVTYQDGPGARTLVSHRHRLAGRPDYVTRGKRGLVPVEVKSRASGRSGPRPGERAQLLAYCLLVEEALGEPVAHGVLRYADRAVTVPFGDRERREVAALLEQMDAEGDPRRSHDQAARCRGCGFRDRCAEALA